MLEQRSVVAIGASTGGLAALTQLLSALPRTLDVPIVITMHIGDRSVLPELLNKACPFPVRFAEEGAALVPGEVLVAPPGAHLLVAKGVVHLGHGAKENFCRPAIDPMFRSVAYSHRAGAIGVLLTGDLDDGTVGLQAISACGGVVIVQDPAEAECPDMPRSALDYVNVDHCLRLQAIAQKLPAIAAAVSTREPRRPSTALEIECDLDRHPAHATSEAMDRFAARSSLVCPECQGVLWETQALPLRFRCHTGHSFTAQTFAQSQDTFIEEALWVAIRAVRDKEVFFKRQQTTASQKGWLKEASEYGAAAAQARSTAETLIQLTVNNI